MRKNEVKVQVAIHLHYRRQIIHNHESLLHIFHRFTPHNRMSLNFSSYHVHSGAVYHTELAQFIQFTSFSLPVAVALKRSQKNVED
jgi:hypothetical protein